MQTKPRIYADFQKTDEQGRLVLTTLGTRRDLERKGITLHQGLELEFYTEDDSTTTMIVSGRVCFDAKEDRWLADVNWNEIKRETTNHM